MSLYSNKVDDKWQKIWEHTNLYNYNPHSGRDKLYCLDMFSYPSGAKLHVGHWYTYGLTDTWARVKKMQGYEIFRPMGFDAFGLPAENYAIKTGVHPYESTIDNINTMRQQLRSMGATFDWDYEVVTCLPDYYKWTQWLFLQLYNNDLAYRTKAPVNWCTSCQTVLANEQVLGGCCERCDSEVVRKDLVQWFFRITKYADELIEQLETMNWPEKTKLMQKNWIGKSTGSSITFALEKHDDVIEVFTTRADTLFGASYMVLAPEHPLVDIVTTTEQKSCVEEYQSWSRKQSEIERLSTTREKTGVFTGGFALHPLTGDKMPIWIADYVLASYGTGAVMAVPGHDTRDYEFAIKFDLPIPRVIQAANRETDDALPFTDYGILVNSGEYSGMSSKEAMEKITQHLQKLARGTTSITYRLRDWLVSRQRYWGAPIPIIYCDVCGAVPVPEEDLPVELPHDVDYAPHGKSPLASNETFINTPCPTCGGPAMRDADTLDTFVCSSWYYLRYPDNKNTQAPWRKDIVNKLLPVDQYVGGPEHACMHLLYARFITKALRDLGYIDFGEPFTSLVHQGIILGPDGNRMSKSRNNVISPDPYVEEHGSDVLRLYLAFGFAYTEGGPWSDDGIKATARFVERVQRLVQVIKKRLLQEKMSQCMGAEEEELNFVRHTAIKGISEDAHRFQFNTCVSRMMELTNALYKYEQNPKDKNMVFMEACLRDLLLIMAPFAPHFCEEMWEVLGYEYSIFNEPWPQVDIDALVRDVIEIAVQINGKVRGKLEVNSTASTQEIEYQAQQVEQIQPYLKGKTVRKVIVVPGRLVNIVVS